MTGYRPPGDTLRSHYARREMEKRGELRVSMNTDLVTRSGNPDACMRWTLGTYHSDVYLGLGYELIGWPPEVPFTNLSYITGLTRISGLLEHWKSGKMHFSPITDKQRRAAKNNPLKAAPAPLHGGIQPRQSRSDVKKRRYRPKTNPLNRPGRFVRDGPKSSRWVPEEADTVVLGVELKEDPIEPFSDDEQCGHCFWCTPCVHGGGQPRQGPSRRACGEELPEDPIEVD